MAGENMIINTFEKGMLQDSLEYLQPKGTYRYARNMTFGDRHAQGYGLATEESNKLVHQYGANIVKIDYVESLDGSVVFLQNQEIHLFDHEKQESTFVASASEFGCDWGFQNCEWLSTTYKTDQPCDEVKVYWSSGCEYYVLNITEMLNEKRKAKLKELIKSDTQNSCGYSCEYFKLMKCVCAPNVTALPKGNGGNQLRSGAYQFVVQLEDNGGNTTNWFTVSNPVSVSSENNIAGEVSLESVAVHLTGLDCRYDKVNIAVISSIEGSMSVEQVASRHYASDGITFLYTGQRGRQIPIEEILIKNKMFIRGKDLIQKDSRLFLYNIRQENNLNMQRRVLEEAKLEFLEIEVSPKLVEKYNMKTLERNERYLFGVTYNYCDGTHSSTFVMRPNGGGGGGAGFSGNFTKPTGEGDFIRRPRGSVAGVDGGVIGCPDDKCGGCAGGGCGSSSSGAYGGGGGAGFSGGGGGGGGAGAAGDCSGTPCESSVDCGASCSCLEGQCISNSVASCCNNWSTETPDLVDSAKCDNCQQPHCCHPETGECLTCESLENNCEGCNKDEEAYANDVPKMEKVAGFHTDELADSNQNKDPNYESTTFKTAAQKIVDSINKSQYRVLKTNKFDISTQVGSPGGGERNTEKETPSLANMSLPPFKDNSVNEMGMTIPNNKSKQKKTYKSVWSDDFTDAKGNYIIDETPVVVGTIAPKPFSSSELYPDSIDCDGEYLYGGLANTPIQLFQTPTSAESPIVVPISTGVPSPNSSADPNYNVKIRLLGIKVSVPEPQNWELPKPLCPNNPYTIVMVPRDEINSTVQAKGVFCGTFTGKSANQDVTFIRHGANSRTYVDRWVSEGPDKKRLAGGGAGPGYAFYGLDTSVNRVALSAREFVTETKFKGQGFRYGLYEKGEEPQDRLNGKRVDQRGARQAINLNVPDPYFSKNTLKAVGYCEANSRNYIAGATNEVSTLDRESCVYFEFSGGPKDTDYSFTTDTYHHSCPIPEAHMWYGHFYRDIPDQYGAIPSMAFIKTGLEGRGFQSPYQGVVGDTFIGPFSFVKKGYVSDKIGDKFPTTKAGPWGPGCERDRSVCDSPNSELLQKLGLDFYVTAFPMTGDYCDAKNWCGGHEALPWNQAYTKDPQFDYYYPKVVKTQISTWIESRVNPWKRATGEQTLGQVFYPKLKELHLDSAVTSDRRPWEKGFLNRFFFKVEQPSIAQQVRYTLIKVIVNIILPMLGLNAFADIQGVPDGVGTMLISPILIAYWHSMKELFTREDHFGRLLGLPTCKTDASGGEDENRIDNFEDNHYSYNADYSKLNYENPYQAMPAVYNTCICNSCLLGETTNEVFYSNKQIEGSTIDFYKQFKALSYLNIPSDSGKLMKMFTFNGDLFAHTTDFIIPVKLSTIGETSNGSNRLGGELIFDPTAYFEGTPEGFAGTKDPNSAINTLYGYAFIDRESRRIFLFDGRAPRQISSGMDRFLKEHLDFCDRSSCHDEKVESGTYYSLGYDPVFNRLLVTKKELDNEQSFTLGVDLNTEQQIFESFHDYIPQSYVWDRTNMYTTKGGGIYLHNSNEGSYRNFYGKEYPSEIEFVALNDTETFEYIDSFVNAEISSGTTKNIDETFNKIAVYNTTQGTGTLPTKIIGDNPGTRVNPSVEYGENGEVKMHKVKRGFRFNNIFDNVKHSCKEQPLTTKDKCVPFSKINESIFDCLPEQRQQYRGKVLYDDHLTYRFTYDQSDDKLLRLLNVKTTIKKDVR